MDPSPYAEQRYKDGLECAKRAVQYDSEGHYSGALSFYSEAVEALNHARSMSPAFLPIQPQLAEYSRRADELSRYLKSNRPPHGLSSYTLSSCSVCIYFLYWYPEGRLCNKDTFLIKDTSLISPGQIVVFHQHAIHLLYLPMYTLCRTAPREAVICTDN